MPWINRYLPKSFILKGMVWGVFQQLVKASLVAGLVTFVLVYAFWPGGHVPEMMIGLLLLFPVIVFSSTWWYLYRYTRSLKQSINYLNRYLLELKRGKFDRKVVLNRNDELQELGERLQEMAGDYKRQVQYNRKVIHENKELITRAEQVASMEERRKLARELHDSVSQELFAASMSMKAIEEMIDRDPGKAQKLFSRASSMIQNAQQELRALILHLRPVTLEGKSLGEGLEQLFQELAQKHKNLSINWEISGLPELPSGVEDQLFRVIQEAVSNTLRHSRATALKVTSKCQDNRIVIILEDDGVGFELEKVKKKPSASYGLKTMEERMMELGGHLNILTYPGAGTRLELRLPVTSEGE